MRTRKRKQFPAWQKMALMSVLVLCMTVIALLLMDRIYPEIEQPFQQRTVFNAYIPNTARAYPAPLARTGEQDITFRVSAEEAGRLEKLAQRRNVRFKVTVE